LKRKGEIKNMKQEMMNINANLVAEPIFSSFEKDGETVEVVNFALVKKYGKGKEYINCAAYGEKVETAKDFEVKSYNKIEKKENKEEE